MQAEQKRLFELPQIIQSLIEKLLGDRGIHFSDHQRIAECVLLSSDYYIQNPNSPTPWDKSWAQIAQIAYYFPLNYLRAQAVYQEALQVGFPMGSRLVDFGSGLGSGSRPFLDKTWNQVTFIEQAPEAKSLHKSYQENGKWIGEKESSLFRDRPDDPLTDSTLIFSYSLTEVDDLPNWAFAANNLVIVEPATQVDGRKLLKIRQNLIEKGFSIWAPCTHQESCPLLEKSNKDWCHDRIHTKMPEWFLDIEKHLPIKNQTLTMSYLLASKTKRPVTNQWRLTGDSLEEKGKTRQLVCRGPEREYLSWMHRHGIPKPLHRGYLIDPLPVEQKSNELRVQANSTALK
jgi:hypothetical protein